jgi:hypothetical protein
VHSPENQQTRWPHITIIRTAAQLNNYQVTEPETLTPQLVRLRPRRKLRTVGIVNVIKKLTSPTQEC